MRSIGFVVICAAVHQAHGSANQLSLNSVACWAGFKGEGCYQDTIRLLSLSRTEVPHKIIPHNNTDPKEILDGNKYQLVERIAGDENVIVFTANIALEHAPRFIIKYFASCLPDDPLVDEFALTKVIYDLQKSPPGFLAVPEMISISGPFVPGDASGSGKELDTLFSKRMDDSWCPEDQKQARFIVEQRVGASCNKFLTGEVNDRDRLLIAIRVFQQGVKLLRSIHQLGIIHGDIHGGNIALRDYEVPPIDQLKQLISGNLPPNWLVLIDFGKAKFIPEIATGSNPLAPDLNLSILSPWHLKGGPIGCRDDVFRLFETLLNMATDNKLADYYKEKDIGVPKLEAPANMAEIKLTEDLVKESGIVATDPSSPILREILALVRGKHTVVNYEELIAKAQLLIDELSRNLDVIIL